ncbi:hypothetical protein OROGR_014947 [Orobanche gracilis]
MLSFRNLTIKVCFASSVIMAANLFTYENWLLQDRITKTSPAAGQLQEYNLKKHNPPKRKRGHIWIRKLSRQMSPGYNSNSTDYPAAVAAAAYAIQSLEERKPKDRKETTYIPDHKSLNKTESEAKYTGALYEPPKSALKSPVVIPMSERRGSDMGTSTSDDKTPTSKKISENEPHTMKRVSFEDNDGNNSNKPEKPAAEKAPEVATPSTIRLPTSTDKLLNKTDSKNTETSKPKPYIPTTQLDNATSQAVAHTWEKKEMAIIKGRYEKLRNTIDNWETNKKKKANSKLQRTEPNWIREEQKPIRPTEMRSEEL